MKLEIQYFNKLQILNKQNAMQGNFEDQNVNNRNSSVSQLGCQLPCLAI